MCEGTGGIEESKIKIWISRVLTNRRRRRIWSYLESDEEESSLSYATIANIFCQLEKEEKRAAPMFSNDYNLVRN